MVRRSTGRAKRNLRHWAHGQLRALTAPSCKQGLSVFLSISVTLSSLDLDGLAQSSNRKPSALSSSRLTSTVGEEKPCA